MEVIKIWLMKVVIVFVIGVFSCGSYSNIDSNLNGTWIHESFGGIDKQIFNNGNFQTFYNDEIIFTGNYTANNGQYFAKINYFRGIGFYHMFSIEPPDYEKWYSEDDIKTIFISEYNHTEEEFYERFNHVFRGGIIYYSITGNELTFTDGEGQGIYIRQ